MQLVLGPSELQTEFTFDIQDLLKAETRPIDSIGLYFSGGIDSTALLILLITELTNIGKINSIPINCYSVVKQDYATSITPKILTTIQTKFEVNIKHVNGIENYNNNKENIHLKTFLDNFLKYRNTLYLVANNRMPPETLVEFKNKLKVDYGHKKNRVVYYSPFLFLHKPQILDIFYKLNCEDLIPYTYSCTMNEITPCQNCYACEERAWGFKMLNKIDPLLAQK
jgi:7-cyano-7-deazaguanine synthase in queuosine biosynthesis